MKKFLVPLLLSISVLSNAQTPPLKQRSSGTFTEVDQYLNVNKTLGIPTNTSDNLISTGTPYKMMYNSTTGKLRVFNGTTWSNADGSPEEGFVNKVSNETINGEKTFTNLINFNSGIKQISSTGGFEFGTQYPMYNMRHFHFQFNGDGEDYGAGEYVKLSANVEEGITISKYSSPTTSQTIYLGSSLYLTNSGNQLEVANDKTQFFKYLYNQSGSEQKFLRFENNSTGSSSTNFAELRNTDEGTQELYMQSVPGTSISVSTSYPGIIGTNGAYNFHLTPYSLFFNSNSKTFELIPNPDATVGLKTIKLPKESGTLVVEKYKVYTAGITQSSSSDPIVYVNDNTLTGSIVWTRVNSGEYIGTLTGAFVTNKTRLFITQTSGSIFSFSRIDENTLKITTGDGTSYYDNLLEDATIEIRVYN